MPAHVHSNRGLSFMSTGRFYIAQELPLAMQHHLTRKVKDNVNLTMVRYGKPLPLL